MSLEKAPVGTDSSIVCEDEGGLVFYRPHEVASLVMEMPRRCRVVSIDGNVSFRCDWPAGDWSRLGEARVNPQALVGLGKSMWSDPAGFVLVGTPEGQGPQVKPLLALTSTGIPLAKVLAIRSSGSRNCEWVTDEGEFTQEVGAEAAARAHPELVLVQEGLYVNRVRLRRLRAQPKSDEVDVILDDGQVLHTIVRSTAQKLAERLGLSKAIRLEPPVPGLGGDFLRDWPFELATASGELLRRHFDSARKLIAHQIYQAFRYHMLGIKRRYGRTHRGFWYRPMHATLLRAGFLNGRRVRWVEPNELARSTDDQLCQRYYSILEGLVGTRELITFQGLGFKELKSGTRRRGKKRPDILLVAEKESISDYGLAVHRKLGISYVETGGYPKLIASEFLAKRWLEAGLAEVEVVAFVDLDPDGWALIEALTHQLARFGLRLRKPPVFVIVGDCLSAEEIETLTLPCDHPESDKVQGWMARGGGIHGRPRRFYANHFEPLARVLARVEELL